MKIQKSVSKTSYLPDQKSVCEQYGLYNTNPGLQTRKRSKEYKKIGNKKGKYKYVPNTHYFAPHDIKLKTHKHEAKQQIKCWICGKNGHYAHECPENDASRKGKGKASEQRAREPKKRKSK
jgi:hypothetical protein